MLISTATICLFALDLLVIHVQNETVETFFVYYKKYLEGKIRLVKVDARGVIWFKLVGENLGFENDFYFCTCFIPPENSTVYTNLQSEMFECDLFDIINDDVLTFSGRGEIFYVVIITVESGNG